MESKIILSPLNENDIDDIVLAFKAIGWNKPKSLYENYLQEQSSATRSVIIAKIDGKFCGYVTMKWKSDYPAFNKKEIPEIVDLNVLPQYQNRGIGTQLIQACEAMAIERSKETIGIGVGMTADYGNAQRLYVCLGYIPDGNGLHYKNKQLQHSNVVTVDDDLVLYFTKKLTV
jgi:ribosomal protein S18 acetylase RimI-like enzyme